ncbi:hypothetical protein [Arthrobacter psychrolactophilus]
MTAAAVQAQSGRNEGVTMSQSAVVAEQEQATHHSFVDMLSADDF